MWYKYLTIILIFYLLALLQSSFFAHFTLWGAVPSLVLIFYVLLSFFSARGWEIIFYSIVAGLLLDIFSSSLFGVSVILLMAIGLLVKKTQQLLSESKGKFLFFHFLLLLFISFGMYSFLINLYFYFTGAGAVFFGINSKLVGEVLYNLLFSAIFFFTYKKVFAGRMDNRQLSLFTRR